MKKLVSLVVVFFAVVVMAGMAQAAADPTDALCTLKGNVTVADYGLPCKDNLTVTCTGNAKTYFKNALVKITAGNKYAWTKVRIPAGTDETDGTVHAEWEYDIFGVTLVFNGDSAFDFGTVGPYASPTITANVGVNCYDLK